MTTPTFHSNDEPLVLELHDPDPRTAFRALLALLQVPVHPQNTNLEGYDLIPGDKPGVWDLIWYGTKYAPGKMHDREARTALELLWDKFEAHVNPAFALHPGKVVSFVCIRLVEQEVHSIIEHYFLKYVKHPFYYASAVIAPTEDPLIRAYKEGARHTGADIAAKIHQILEDDQTTADDLRFGARIARLRSAFRSLELEYGSTE